MQVMLVVKEWRNSNLEIVKRDNVADGAFSEGSVFYGAVHMEYDDETKLKEEIRQGYFPIVLLNLE